MREAWRYNTERARYGADVPVVHVSGWDDLQFVTNPLPPFSNQQIVGQKSLTMMLTGARRVLVHDNCCYFQNCRKFDVVTDQIGQFVRCFQLHGRAGGWRSQVIEAECRFFGRRFGRLGTL